MAGWADAAGYTVADLTMVRKELVIGYVVAGFLSVMVPMEWWNTLFVSGHGFWTSLENALVAPVIACISFVCSIGNVPMAAALWHGGISFGGVITFIFADLLALPLIFIYRKYYGGRLALRMVGVFYVVMVAAGLAVEGLFALFGWIPTERPEAVVSTGFHLDVTLVLNVVGLIVLAAVYLLYRNRARFGGGTGYAIDPICGMQVRTADAPAWSDAGGERVWFCSDRCRERYEAELSGDARTVVSRPRSRVRGGRGRALELERHVVDVAPVPLLARLVRADEGMSDRVEVGGGVARPASCRSSRRGRTPGTSGGGPSRGGRRPGSPRSRSRRA